MKHLKLNEPFHFDAGENIFLDKKKGSRLMISVGKRIVCLEVRDILDAKNAVMVPVKIIEEKTND